MPYRSMTGAILVLGLLAAGPALASNPALYPNSPENPINRPRAGSSPQALLQYWQSKEKLDEQRAAQAQSRHNTTAYNRWEQVIARDQQRITRLQQRIAKQPAGTLTGGTRGLNGGFGLKGGGTAGANKRALRQAIMQEIQKDRQFIQKVSARLQQDRTSDPSRVSRDKQILADLRVKLRDDVALRQKSDLSEGDLQSASPIWQKFWSDHSADLP